MTKQKKVDSRIFKKTSEELHSYLMLMGKHQVIKNKKGKGSYNRKNIEIEV